MVESMICLAYLRSLGGGGGGGRPFGGWGVVVGSLACLLLLLMVARPRPGYSICHPTPDAQGEVLLLLLASISRSNEPSASWLEIEFKRHSGHRKEE